ncbi:MAG TPA: D-tagatose-bisphosphate aldolase, class II, non-catalytic subunit [Balneolaceae bacterium]|nr:D-tagatose-bisphosphate aldolase, class II, non-catalytic subunit [Balneolaceae bacterium]
MQNHLLDIVEAQANEEPIGVYSVCSSNKYVLKAAILQARKDDSFVLIEPTANQVNQFGGYTGMKPEGFVNFLSFLADEAGFPKSRIVLGGDHLGPNPWRSESAQKAMEKSRELVRQYVEAGFTKIHLDTSIPCADDEVAPGAAMDDQVVAQRAADLCRVAEDTFQNMQNDLVRPVYVIGTEVPIPGGAEGELHDIRVTEVEAARNTLETTKKAFLSEGLEEAWDRVIAQVVQPGVEFGNSRIVEYDPGKASDLSAFIKEYDDKIFEAHSTDYQPLSRLKKLVKDSFAILKVGPWLTFAFREAIFSLSYIEEELLSGKASVELSNFRAVLEDIMINNPASWENYYDGKESRLKFLRKYSYSDRSRYYWQKKSVQEAVNRLFRNLTKNEIPIPLISQFLPSQFKAIHRGDLEKDPEAMSLHKVQEILKIYSKATGQRKLHLN